MKTVLNFSNKHLFELPKNFEDIRFTDEFAEFFINEFTKERDKVFDPFAGFGTTLRVAEKMNRIAYGTEYDQEKVAYARKLLKNPERMIFGDALKLKEYDIPNFNFSLTSPPYMQKADENPFHTVRTTETDYEQYLKDLASVYEQIKEKLLPGGVVAIEVSNVRRNGIITTLAWDIARKISEVLKFEGEVVINWDGGYGYDYDHSYVLVFRKTA